MLRNATFSKTSPDWSCDISRNDSFVGRLSVWTSENVQHLRIRNGGKTIREAHTLPGQFLNKDEIHTWVHSAAPFTVEYSNTELERINSKLA